MNKSTIVVLIVVFAAMIGMFITMVGASSYSSFADARAMTGEQVTIIGQLNKSKEIFYDPQVNANRTEFFVVDGNGEENKVVFHDAKPRDIERSEEITMEGKMIKDEFHATHILLKCPSKYNANSVGKPENIETSFEAEIPE